MKLLDSTKEPPPEKKGQARAGTPSPPVTKRVVHRPIKVKPPLAKERPDTWPEFDTETTPGSDNLVGREPTKEVPSRAHPPGGDVSTGLHLRGIESAPKRRKAPPGLQIPAYLRPDREKTRYAFWNVTATLSLIVNAVLMALLILLGSHIDSLKASVSDKTLYEGLYYNFGKMDEAHIRADIPINTSVHTSLQVNINQTTDVILVQSTTISGARTTLTTGGLEIISAPTNITLPAGTVLPVQLNLSVPVEADIPVSMTIPVDIPLNQTGLHEPFLGLQDTARRYICLFEPDTLDALGNPICALPAILTPTSTP